MKPVTSASMAGALAVGRLAAEAGVGRVVLVHQLQSVDPTGDAAEAIAEVQSVFDGPVQYANEFDHLEFG